MIVALYHMENVYNFPVFVKLSNKADGSYLRVPIAELYAPSYKKHLPPPQCA